MAEESKGLHEELPEDIALPEDLEDEMAEDMPLEDEDDAEADYLDKPEDLTGDNDEYHDS